MSNNEMSGTPITIKDREMVCAYCGQRKKYPHDFPVSYYAKCKDCYKGKAK